MFSIRHAVRTGVAPDRQCTSAAIMSLAPSRRRRSWVLFGPLALMFSLVTLAVVSAQGFWTTLPSMPTARSGPGSAAAPCPKGLDGTCVYSVGGADASGGTFFATLEAYSPKSDTWVTLPSMPTARGSLAAAAAPCPQGLQGTCLYAVGGFDGSNFVGTLEAYSPKSNIWTTLPSMPTPRLRLGAAAAPCPQGVKGTCLFAVGGQSDGLGLRFLEAYSPKSNSWLTLPSMPTARQRLGAAAAPCTHGVKGTCVYAVGGLRGSAALGTLEAFITP
jgi:hypothetical protein